MTLDISTTDDVPADAPEWAKAMHEDIEQNTEKIDSLTKTKDATDDPWGKDSDLAEELRRKVAENQKRLDRVAGIDDESAAFDDRDPFLW